MVLFTLSYLVETMVSLRDLYFPCVRQLNSSPASMIAPGGEVLVLSTLCYVCQGTLGRMPVKQSDRLKPSVIK